jgi:DNA mismatch repair protein MutS
MAERTGMMDQYRRIKANYRDAILFFRLGDFYEMFFEDALQASTLLDLTLTKRQGQPMCGIPYHAAKPYIARLLKAGKKVAICEQLSAPGSRGIVDRDVVEVVTPGTTIEEDFIDHNANNYLASVCFVSERLCISYLDVSTGEFRAYSSEDSETQIMEFLRSELSRIAPREIIVQQSLLERQDAGAIIKEQEKALIERRPDWCFEIRKSFERITQRFGVASLKGFGFSESDPELAAAGVLLEYLDETTRSASPHIRALLPYERNKYLSIDDATRKNLELVRNLSTASDKDSLLSVLDRTRTAGGFRNLRRWILQPLRDKKAIESRLDAVEFLYRNQRVLGEIRQKLSIVLDTERLIARLSMDKAHAKDLLALRDSLSASLDTVVLLRSHNAPSYFSGSLTEVAEQSCRSTIESIDGTIAEEPSILITEGNIIQSGWCEELDRLRELKSNSTKILEAYLEEEKNNSGIQTLRIRYNRIIGYYLEVTKGKLESVPSHFIRRQSLVTGERYTTDRLADLESEINGATEKIVDLEKRLFLEHRECLKKHLQGMEELAATISRLDSIASFAQKATEAVFCRPELCEEPILDIGQGRHPVVESCLPYGAFVPNDLHLGLKRPYFALITGPNMAGKSTVLRQTALIALMAHIGSFVPADKARIGLIDKIFCRVGAQDNLARGESTFLVEMHETAYILNTATPSSLVIMDEVGRGTGTLDGVSIAWAVSEHLLQSIGCRTLFATHYHELTSMIHEKLENFSMSVLENEGDIVFLKKLKPGPAAGSYGLHVAKLAGIPESVLEKAKILHNAFSKLEKALSPEHINKTYDASNGSQNRKANEKILELFSPEDLALTKVKSLDPNRMTPIEALQTLIELKKLLL